MDDKFYQTNEKGVMREKKLRKKNSHLITKATNDFFPLSH